MVVPFRALVPLSFLGICLAQPALAQGWTAPGAEAKEKVAAKPGKSTEKASDAQPDVSESTSASPGDFDQGADTDALLKKARGLYDALEYDQVPAIVDVVLSREGLTPKQKLDGYLLRGSSLAIVGDPIEAEKPFRLLLRGLPDFDMPPETPPKILAVFRKVQVEERSIREQLAALQRQRTMESLELIGEHPTEGQGGFPIAFGYRLKDPNSAVDAIRVQYRRQGEAAFSSLALKRDGEGVWRGRIPGEWTANEDGAQVEFYLETLDRDGPLLADGSKEAPLAIALAAGSVDRAKPPPLPLWGFVAAASGAGVLAVAATGTGIAELMAQNDYNTYAEQGLTETIVGSTLQQKRQWGENLALTTTVLWSATAAVAVVAGVMVPFTNWTGRTLDDEPEVASE